jgi:hypothetical protein
MRYAVLFAILLIAAAGSATSRAEEKDIAATTTHSGRPRPRPLLPSFRPRERLDFVHPNRELEAGATIEPGESRPGTLGSHELWRLGLRPRGIALKDVSSWPAEPESPSTWDAKRFAQALRELCPATVPANDIDVYASLIREHSARFGVDAALIAAVVYQQSGCDAQRRNAWGAGLSMLNRGFFNTRNGVYPYVRFENGSWVSTELDLSLYPLVKDAFLSPASNVYFAAGLLAVFAAQCPHIDQPLRSQPHRHFVSHFIWGDVVHDAGPEDRILTARRRFLDSYRGKPGLAPSEYRGMSFGCPLDGCPRVATSGLGEMREGGKRRHAGVDLIAHFGEPVRAIADGVVIQAGTDLKGERLVNVAPERAALVPLADMGARGLYVRIRHVEGVESVYAHLASYSVRAGDKVRRGDNLGYVGLTGVRQSEPHLHFGLFAEGLVVDPSVALGGAIFGPEKTLRGRSEPSPIQTPGQDAPTTTRASHPAEDAFPTVRTKDRSAPGACHNVELWSHTCRTTLDRSKLGGSKRSSVTR